MRTKALKALVYEALEWFSTAQPKLHPKSVGGSVDKVFAYRCRPRFALLSELWLKIDQCLLETVYLNKSRIFFS